MHAVPGGPFDTGERRLPEATRQAQLHKYGLDKSLPEQYVRYIWSRAPRRFRGAVPEPERDRAGLIARAWPVTIRIGIPTIIISLPSAQSSARSPRSAKTRGSIISSRPSATLGLTVPNFVVATWLILILSTRWTGCRPADGASPRTTSCRSSPTRWPRWRWWPIHAGLRFSKRCTPIMSAPPARRGLGEQRVLRHHVARNAADPGDDRAACRRSRTS